MAEVEFQPYSDFYRQKGICASCGYLALLRKSDSAMVEADTDFREHGEPTEKENLHNTPNCFAQKYRLFEEVHKVIRTTRDEANAERKDGGPEVVQPGPVSKFVGQVIHDERRACDEWTPYYQGFSPKEHREMLDRQRMREREREWREADQSWLREERQARESFAKAEAEDRKKEAEDRGNELKWLKITAIAIVIAALIAAVIQVAAAFIERGGGPVEIAGPIVVVEASPTPTITPTPTPIPPNPST